MKLNRAILELWSAKALAAETIERYAIDAWNDYDLRLDDESPVVDRYEWQESQHPRFDAGAAGGVGGQFKPTGQSAGQAVGNRPGGRLSDWMLKASQATNEQGRMDAMNGGRPPAQATSSPVAPPLLNDRSQALAQAVKQAFAKPKVRELAERPDIQKGHPLHHSSLPPDLQSKILDWNGRVNQLLNPMNLAASQATNDEARVEARERAWQQVDKSQIRGMLDEMNNLDREARKSGIPLSDFVNANGIIPRELAERLDGGSRFFDPEKLRGKLGNGPIRRTSQSTSTNNPVQSNQPSTGDRTVAREFMGASALHRKQMLDTPSMRAAIERAMGLKPTSGTVANIKEPEGAMGPKPLPKQPTASPTVQLEPTKKQGKQAKSASRVKHLPEANRALRALGYKPAEAGALLRKLLNSGAEFGSSDDLVQAALSGAGVKQATNDNLSSIASGKLDSAINEIVGGDDLDKRQHFKQVAFEAWKDMKSVADDHNDALRQLTSFFGKHHGALAANISKGVDITKLKGFDEMIDHAVREYPQLVSRLGSDSSAGGPEDALVEALREGIREVPQPWHDEVIDRAMEMVGPGFLEDTPAMARVGDTPIEWDDGPTPFSAKSDLARMVARYWRSASIHWLVDRYSFSDARQFKEL